MISRAGITLDDAINAEAPLADVDDIAWARFEHALTLSFDRGSPKSKPRAFDAVSNTGLGCYGIPARRLVEIGILKEVFFSKGRAIANPRDKRLITFLTNPEIQRKALLVSLKLYDRSLGSELAEKHTLPAGMTRSGALALFHRLGPKALQKWAQHQEHATIELFRRANQLF